MSYVIAFGETGKGMMMSKGSECCWMACYTAAGETVEGMMIVKASE